MSVEKLIFEKGAPGRRASNMPAMDVPTETIEDLVPAHLLRQEEAPLPEVSEIEVVRHYTHLSQRNFGVDTGFYPLGSCTMKYNPKVNEDMAGLPGFAHIHPLQPAEQVQGAIQLVYELEQYLAEIAGMTRVTLQPSAGAHGELTGLMLIKAYHQSRGEGHRHLVLIPDNAHGTNPASATLAGYKSVELKSDKATGGVDMDHLRQILDAHANDIAAIMLTNPNTLGLFEANILEIARLVHEAGGQLYYDGANANAVMGITRPGDMGFDVVHFNLHKTCSTPHGGGGPGAGPIGVKEHLVPFLPGPLPAKDEQGRYYWQEVGPQSIGKVRANLGNFGVLVRAYTYIRSNGPDGLRHVSESAILNANYVKHGLSEDYEIYYPHICQHEFVATARRQKEESGVTAMDIAKRLLDFGMYAPTTYFPLIVPEALMIEPTETETRETLDTFIAVMKQIAEEARTNPELVKTAPHTTVVGRLDQALAARKPNLRWTPGQEVTH
ncbi:glycine dehydrogenase subunit 2 [Thermosporothrix hazakensis]|jgi:glycine dehydrogenase subunit 2|uniref:Probable glycine dehydrogenase (decarboxylating) subunit 2 n=2 Tax=Thermosporothrix TaxID=768650 RepID=A0A326TZT8_THEHA|nr:aminomethyl-transferring glycine dehydrogenase subunit GcvPB [Thermosporothrix hazakensis]PZW22964.1 glycine dehydrogenase subunit 2 [Thermosporothrix hazakensis]BBH90056.1 putative glycine dehydrogenase (decarboxylating) subunit 2 [Thermosporothrix sp. COM3]GCE48277.1 putative glycine dehydrogenase (decarboxylating) subunit 2 [Thermosporothrix hazakensis]